MKRFLKNIVLFAGYATLFYVSCIILWGQCLPSSLNKNLNYRIGSYGHMNSRIKDLKSHGSADVLILGSSHAYRGFDPRIFKAHGIDSFNLGSSAQTPIQTEVLLNRYLESLNPKLVIYEVFPNTFTGDGVESAVDLIANDRNDIDTINMALNLNHVKVYNTLLYGLYRDCFSMNSDFEENVKKDNDTYIEGGFVEKEMGYYEKKNGRPAKRWNLRQAQLSAFERILKKLKEKGIVVVLVLAPITGDLYDSYSNISEVEDYLKPLGDYYNFNELLELSDSKHFYDSHHLNQTGVAVFNRELFMVLKKDDILRKCGIGAGNDR